MMHDNPRIAVCFFGITRSLSLTLPSIEAQVFEPVRAAGELKVFAHFFEQHRINNPRSLEKGRMDVEEYKLLSADWIKLEQPENCMQAYDIEALQSFGDYWNDGFISFRNLIHQLHSLYTVTQAALEEGFNTCIFCRPDLQYHDSFAQPLAQALRCRSPRVFLPIWQPFDGLNDRFALCVGKEAIAAYGQRIRQALAYCQSGPRPLHSEGLVQFSLAAQHIKITAISHRATRTRLGGATIDESFEGSWRTAFKHNNPALTKAIKLIKPRKSPQV